MKCYWPASQGEQIKAEELTGAQWDTLATLQKRHNLPEELTVIPGLGYVGVMAGNLFIGIEPDGYSHT